MKKTHNVPVQSVGKSMELLDILTERKIPMSLTELSKETGYPKSTIYAILTSMREYNVINQLQDGKYCLGIKLFECGCVVSKQWDMTTIAPPYLEHLSQTTQASSFICVMNDQGIMNILQRAGGAGLHVISDVGYLMPLYATSSGKLYLAHLRDEEKIRKCHQMELKRLTSKTITDPQRLIKELDQIQLQGYAIEDSEYHLGLQSISAPVYNREGQLIYAVGIVGLLNNLHSPEFQDAIVQVKNVAEQLSNALGHV